MRIESSVALAVLACAAIGAGQAGERLMSVRDSIAVRQFIEPDVDTTDQVRNFSPDGRHFLVVTQRGLLARDRVESTIWLFDVAAEEKFLARGADGPPPRPIALAALAGITQFYEQTSETVAVTDVHWSSDSLKVFFLGRDNSTEWHLYQVDLATRHLSQLTPDGQNVAAYAQSRDVRLYAVSIPFRAPSTPRQVVGTGVGLSALLSPGSQLSYPNQDELWVQASRGVHPVVDRASGLTVRLNKHFDINSVILSPSPDGRVAVVAQAVSSIPASWQEYEAGAVVGRIRSVDPRRLARATAYEVPERFVLVSLETGQATPMVDGPLGRGANWWTATQASWSPDGRRVLLSNVFLPTAHLVDSERRKLLSAPVVALYDLASGSVTPVASFKRSRLEDPRRWHVASVRWDVAAHEIILRYSDGGPPPETYRVPGYESNARHGTAHADDDLRVPLDVRIHQDLNAAPTLYAALPGGTAAAARIWDPNPGLAAFDLGVAEAYNWKDPEGRLVKGVLIKPPHFDPARRYPLVIEARAYHQDRFVLDGTYATAVAARAMAADGLLVLQAGEPAAAEQDMFNGATERALHGYESVVTQLAAQGRIDPGRVGIIGFSRTCDTVLYAITHDPKLFAAATLANGLTYGPMQYLADVDATAVVNLAMQQWDLHYHGRPLGAGLNDFVRNNSVFKIAAVTTPVRIETRSGHGDPLWLITDWESYAALRSLDKPVDLIVLPDASHVVSMPSDVMASQQGEVDWMRFWLQGHEDRRNGAKAGQYRRWEALCDMQATQNPHRRVFCRRTGQHS